MKKSYTVWDDDLAPGINGRTGWANPVFSEYYRIWQKSQYDTSFVSIGFIGHQLHMASKGPKEISMIKRDHRALVKKLNKMLHADY